MPEQRSARRELRNAAPECALDRGHTVGGQLLPDRLALLDLMPRQAVVAEIGVAKGDFSTEILARTAPRRLHLIDIWKSDRYAEDEATLRNRFKAQTANGQVEINKCLSLDALKAFPDNYFDWVYIDSDHSYPTTAGELALCDTCVKPAGLILGHDFCTGNIVAPVVYGVVQAVNQFCLQRRWRYHYVTLESHGHFSFCIGRINPSPTQDTAASVAP